MRGRLEKHHQSPFPGGSSSCQCFLLDLPVLGDVSGHDGSICLGQLTVIQLMEEFPNSPVVMCTCLGMSYAGFAAAREADPEGKRWG